MNFKSTMFYLVLHNINYVRTISEVLIVHIAVVICRLSQYVTCSHLKSEHFSSPYKKRSHLYNSLFHGQRARPRTELYSVLY